MLEAQRERSSFISVSLVSHGHGPMVWRLVDQLILCPEVAQIIVTLNIPEVSPSRLHEKVILLINDSPKGFGANHNAAFDLACGVFYCVINPDIELTDNPFPELIKVFADSDVGLTAPLVVGPNRVPEDSMRRFLTPWSVSMRVLRLNSGTYFLEEGGADIFPDWIAGMFMLFRSKVYERLTGFDERYFMYCEDADICTRVWKFGYKIVGCLSVSVIHSAQRASRHSFKHFSWHAQSIMRYFLKNFFSLPNTINP